MNNKHTMDEIYRLHHMSIQVEQFQCWGAHNIS